MESLGLIHTVSPLSSPPQAISKAFKNSDSLQLIIIGGLMILAVIMSFLMLLGSLRKSTNNSFFNGCLWATVALTPLAITYCIGKMTTKTDGARIEEYDLFLIWGIILLSGLASYGTISAFELEDNETASVAYFQGFMKCCFFVGMLLGYIRSQVPAYLWCLLFFLAIGLMLRLHDRANSLACASKTNLTQGVGSKVKFIDDFMTMEVQKTLEAEGEVVDPKTMKGYRYLVGIKHLIVNDYKFLPPCYRIDFEKEKENIITTEEIWQCEGSLLSTNGGDPEGRLKDICLSFVLFWMLLRRYVGYPFVEANLLKEKTWSFVRYGLISEISVTTTERAFRVIEQELSFLYDYFYTKNFITYLYGVWTILIRFFLMVAFVLIAYFLLKNQQEILPLIISNKLPHIKLGILITKIVIGAMVIFETILMIHYLLITQWSRVDWVCIYIKKQLWRSQSWNDICLRWVIEHVCRLSLRKRHKNWKREMGQYSLISSHEYISLLHRFNVILPLIPLELLDKQKMGRKESKSISLSLNIKKAILLSFHENGRQLSNGKFSLRKYGVESDFSWACNLETHTQTILVWHIATSFCEYIHFNQHPKTLMPNTLGVATGLSKYCAYLVAFAPKLLPDQTYTTLNIINNVILEATNMFEGCSNLDDKFEKMREMTCECIDAKDPIMKKGIWLGKSLVDRMSTEPLWEMLGEFRAELLLYLAPSDNIAVHIKYLADGGEFITHLWTLLTHAGILKRD